MGKKLIAVGILFLLAFVTVIAVKPEWAISLFSRQERINPLRMRGDFQAASQAVFNDEPVILPRYRVEAPVERSVLGETNIHKRIEVDLSNQRLYAYEGDTKVYDFLISSGKWGRTPIGRFQIWIKLRYALMKGGNKALGTYYYLPNVPYTMYLYNDEHPQYEGYGIHGAYWHNNFGHPMSHGCINMAEEDVKQLYYWAEPDLQGKKGIRATDENPGTEVIIYGETPAS